MKHTMTLYDAPFQKIKSGEKTIELRLYDEKRKQIKTGDIIEFTHRDHPSEVLTAQVKGIHVYASFEELYRELPLKKCGYTEQDIDTASPHDMDVFYSESDQRKYGAVGIEITLLD